MNKNHRTGVLIEYPETEAQNTSFSHLMPFITVHLVRFEISENSFSFLVYHKAFCPLLLDVPIPHRELDSLSITTSV